MDADHEPGEPWIIEVSGDTDGDTAADCDHDARRQLGGDAGGNVYFRCEHCGSVLIQEGTVAWQEHREAREEALAEREQGDNPLRGLLESEEGGIFDEGKASAGREARPARNVRVRVRRMLRRIRGR